MTLSGRAVGSSLIYDEIRDTESSFRNEVPTVPTSRMTCDAVLKKHTNMTSRLTSDSVSEMPTGAEALKSHDQETNYYELIETAEYQSMDGAYKVQQCVAYGTASSVIKSHDPPGQSCDLSRSHVLSDLSSSSDPDGSYLLNEELNCSAHNGQLAEVGEKSHQVDECPVYLVCQ